MDILFVNPQGELKLNQEINGQLLLGTILLEAGFDVDILRFCQVEGFPGEYDRFIGNMTRRILATDAKAVCFYCLWPDYHIMLRIAKELKAARPEVITVFGGPQPSASAAATMENMAYVDYLCTSEGEHTVVPFFTALLRNGKEGLDQIPGLYYRQNGQVIHNDLPHPLCDLNTLPHWDMRLLSAYEQEEKHIHSKHYFMPIDAGRGCPYSCTFCCTSGYWRKTYRLKSPERIVEDIIWFKENFGITSFWFSHDAFTSNKKLVEKVCDYIIEKNLNITWHCSTRIDCITPELIDKMIQSGLIKIELGVETGSQRMQKCINKNLDLNKVKPVVQMLLEKKLSINLFFMYGLPEETEEDLFQTIDLELDLLDMGVRSSSTAFCRFNPTTQMTVNHFKDLKFDPSIDVLSRDVLGYEEELETILSNKAIFPFFYHLETPVRRKHQYLIYFFYIYKKFPNSAKQLRKLFENAPISFYQAFCQENAADYHADHKTLMRAMKEHPLEMMKNTLKTISCPQAQQICGLLEFDLDLQTVSGSTTDLSIQKEYSFCYVDFQRKLPITEYIPGKTTILLKKEKGVTDLQILNIQ